MLERRDACPVRQVGARSGLDKRAHGLDVPQPAVAQDHSLDQRRPANMFT
jgi:hypothetical protein